MAKTKGTAGRFGARYGKKIRTRVNDIEKKQKALHVCPYCKAKKVKREAAGIWLCTKCNSKFTGRAYIPKEK